MIDEKLSNSVTESVPVLSVHSSYKVQSGLVQIQFNLFTLPNALDCLLFKTRNVMKPPFSDDTASNGGNKRACYCKEYMCELFHQFSSRNLQNVCPDRQCSSRSDFTDCTA